LAVNTEPETLYYSRMESPVGPLLIGASKGALVMLEFDRGLPEQIAGRPIHWEESELTTGAIRQQLTEYFAGERKKFSLRLDLRGTEFRKRCWEELLRIPYGQTRTYGEIARSVGNASGFRAVGQANHFNPIAIIVPCHRVLATGGYLGGYGGGLAIKAFLLRLEGAKFRELPEEKPSAQAALTGL
jgi:methylated-DNA-[protein]-cysteine S-methyltransferase